MYRTHNCGLVRLKLVNNLSQSKISNLYSISFQQDIFWLDISMNNALFLKIAASVDELFDERKLFFLIMSKSMQVYIVFQGS